MRPRGGIIGASTAPTTTSAKGVWSLREAELYTRDVTFPALANPPTNVSGGGGNQAVALTWAAPTQNGGSAITDYVIQYSTDGGSTWTTFSHSASSSTTIQVTGLTNGTTYVFRVATVTSFGTGGYSATSASVTPVGSIISLAYTAGAWSGSGTSAAPFTSSSVFGPTNNALLPFSFTAISDADVTFSMYQYNSTLDDNHGKQSVYYRVNGANAGFAAGAGIVDGAPAGSAVTSSGTLRLFAGEVFTVYPSGSAGYSNPTDLYTTISMGAVAPVSSKLKMISSPFALTGTGTVADPFVAPSPLTQTNFPYHYNDSTKWIYFRAMTAGTLYVSGTNVDNQDDNSSDMQFVWKNVRKDLRFYEGRTGTISTSIARGDVVAVQNGAITFNNLSFWVA